MGIEEEGVLFPEICTPDVAELELETRVIVTTSTEEAGPADDDRGAIWCKWRNKNGIRRRTEWREEGQTRGGDGIGKRDGGQGCPMERRLRRGRLLEGMDRHAQRLTAVGFQLYYDLGRRLTFGCEKKKKGGMMYSA
jgi:hypothetical protein